MVIFTNETKEGKHKMILVIDNNDSFTYNLIDYFKTVTDIEIIVYRINQVTIQSLQQLNPSALVISPGPGNPSDYPIIAQIIAAFKKRIPILGVCLGFQCIYDYFGGRIIHGKRPVHGHTTKLNHNNKGIFAQLPQHFEVMRYHSLIAERQSLPAQLEISAENDEGIIMAVQHRQWPIYAVQYHPESILSEHGHAQIELFIKTLGVNQCDNTI